MAENKKLKTSGMAYKIYKKIEVPAKKIPNQEVFSSLFNHLPFRLFVNANLTTLLVTIIR